MTFNTINVIILLRSEIGIDRPHVASPIEKHLGTTATRKLMATQKRKVARKPATGAKVIINNQTRRAAARRKVAQTKLPSMPPTITGAKITRTGDGGKVTWVPVPDPKKGQAYTYRYQFSSDSQGQLFGHLGMISSDPNPLTTPFVTYRWKMAHRDSASPLVVLDRLARIPRSRLVRNRQVGGWNSLDHKHYSAWKHCG